MNFFPVFGRVSHFWLSALASASPKDGLIDTSSLRTKVCFVAEVVLLNSNDGLMPRI